MLRMTASALAPVFALVARTGIGSDACLKHGFLPVPIHYYQPIFDHSRVTDSVWESRSSLAGIDFDEGAQVEVLAALAAYGGECEWPEKGTGYHWDNRSFGYTSACLLHAMVRWLQPRQIIEVGAGWSTLVSVGAMARNGRVTLTTIDPYAPEYAAAQGVHVIREPIELTDPHLLATLGENDLLFIDSSHVARTGGDVNFLYLDVLPRLRSGVVVHIHDIYLPYEYPRIYSQRERSRFFWNEQYLLQAFLALNPAFRVELASYLVFRDHAAEFAAAFPGFDPARHREPTSFYIRRV